MKTKEYFDMLLEKELQAFKKSPEGKIASIHRDIGRLFQNERIELFDIFHKTLDCKDYKEKRGVLAVSNSKSAIKWLNTDLYNFKKIYRKDGSWYFTNDFIEQASHAFCLYLIDERQMKFYGKLIEEQENSYAFHVFYYEIYDIKLDFDLLFILKNPENPKQYLIELANSESKTEIFYFANSSENLRL